MRRGNGTGTLRGMADLLIAEELFLLTHDDETGKTSSSTMSPDTATAGALLLDLAEHGAMTIDEKKKVHVTDQPLAHPLLEQARAVIAGDGKVRSVSHWISYLPSKLKKIQEQVGGSLAARGILEREEHKSLGLFTTVRWPERDPAPERQLRAGLADVLVRGASPTAHQELLIPLLQGQNLVRTLVEKDDRAAAKATAKALSKAAKEGKLVSSTVSRTVQATQAAVMTTIMVPAIVATSSS